MTLTADQSRSIANTWRQRFTDETAFDLSVERFFDKVGDPTPEKLTAWLAKDQAKDEARNAASPHTPPLPVRSRYDTNDCYHCHGWGYVRALDWAPDVPISHPAFGRAVRCPACSNPHHRCDHCTP